MTIDADPDRRPLPVVETAAYFVVAEALTNVAKHAGGAAAHVRVTLDAGDTLVLEIADEGPGGADANGSGLAGLRSRVEALDGTLAVTSPAGGRNDRASGAAMRAVIVEDLALLREGIVALLRENGVDVVAQAEDGPGLERIVAGHKPDLAIVDVRLPPTFTDEGLRAAIEARRRHPGLGVLVLSQYVEPVYTAELLASGEAGVGYLLKERVGEVRAFIDAVQRVADGGTALDREVVAELMRARQAGGGDADTAIGSLTPREREVLELMAEGRSNAAVARALVVTRRRRREARAQHLREARSAGQRRRPPPRARRARVPAGGRRVTAGRRRGTLARAGPRGLSGAGRGRCCPASSRCVRCSTA